MDKLPVSVFIITKDEEDRLPYAINSVKDWADEVIVIDSGSTDNTEKVAKDLGADFVFNQWNGYGPQKVYGEGLCKNDWLLNIDADEEITESLRDEIINLFKNGEPEKQGYYLKIKVLSRFADKVHKFAPVHNPIRLYNKNHAGFKDSTVHDSVIMKSGNSGQLKGDVNHRSFRSYTHAITKINRYSSMQAEDMVKRGRKPTSIRIIFEPFIGFIKGYFIKRYCFLGIEGFIEAIIYAFARTLRLAKTREMWKIRKEN